MIEFMQIIIIISFKFEKQKLKCQLNLYDVRNKYCELFMSEVSTIKFDILYLFFFVIQHSNLMNNSLEIWSNMHYAYMMHNKCTLLILCSQLPKTNAHFALREQL
jgi:hypothetical protein